MYPTSGQLVLAFHGCDKSLKDRVVARNCGLRPSKNRWDWLGHGVYFWEADPKRAMEFAKLLACRKNSTLKTPAVIGAVLDLGHCLNLLNRRHLTLVKRSYNGLRETMKLKGKPMPINQSLKGNSDLLLRDLDCAVINFLHDIICVEKQQPYDSVRAAFWEGQDLYAGAGFRELSHIQICVRNPNCIKGYFDLLKRVSGWPRV